MATATQTNWKALGLSFDTIRGAYKRIGFYRRNDGKVIKKTFYLGHDPLFAYREKEKLQTQWRQKRAEAKKVSRLSGMEIVPLWDDNEPLERIHQRGRYINLPLEADNHVYDEVPPKQVLTMAEAQKMFFENYGERMGLAGRRGIIQNTFNSMSRLLPRALAPFSPDTDLTKLTYRDFEKFCNYWCRKPENERGNPSADRTVHDYLRRALQFFVWLENRPDLTFRMPKGTCRLMKDSMQGLNSPSDFEYFTFDQLKDMMAAAPERTKLYIMIALNTGHLNVDIATIYFDYAREGVISKLVLDGEAPYLLKTRWKNRRKFKTPVKHFLWPETVALMKKFLNPDAKPGNLCFLNEAGGTLYREIKNGSSCPIHTSWERLRQKYKQKDGTFVYSSGRKTFRFKDLRKTAAQGIHEIAQSKDIADYFEGHKLGQVQSAYLKPLTKDMNEVVMKYGEQLRAAGVIKMPEVGQQGFAPTAFLSDESDNKLVA